MSLAPEFERPVDSPLRRWEPRCRTLAIVAAIAGSALLRSWGPAIGAVAIGAVMAAVARGSVRRFRQRLTVVLIAVLPFAIVLPFTVDRGSVVWEWRNQHVTDAGLIASAVLLLKTVAMTALLSALLAAATLPETLGSAGRLGVPRIPLQITLLAHRYVFLLLDELNRVRIALRTRGFRNGPNRRSYRTIGHAVGALLVRGSNRADRVGHAMRCRGFQGRFPLNTARPPALSDLVAALIVVAGITGLIVWDYSA